MSHVPVLDILSDELSCAQEGLLDILSSLGRGLDENEPILFSKLCGLVVAHVHLALQVLLVSNEHDDSVGVGEIASISEPGGEVVEGRSAVEAFAALSIV